jgi:hypothetical protein
VSSTGRTARVSCPGGPGSGPPPGRPQWPSQWPPPWPSAGRGWRARWGANRCATAALVAGIAGAALVTIPVSLVCGVLGLRQAQRAGPGAPGRVRSWLGIALALGWAALAGYLLPHLIRAADPGCVNYKGSALAAYERVIDDFGAGADDATTARDLRAAIRKLDGAAAQSRSGTASGSLAALSTQLQTVLSDVQAHKPVPGSVLRALNRDSARADGACGTVRL